MTSDLVWVAVFILAVTSITLLISQKWRVSFIALIVQYLAVFGLVALVWPLNLAIIKPVVGIMAGVMLSMAKPDQDILDQAYMGISGRVFRVLAAIAVMGLVWSLSQNIGNWLPGNPELHLGGLILIGSGLLHLGMTTRPLRVILALLTVLSGFEILYALVETSFLVNGLLAIANLALALVGAYLLASPEMEPGA
jgi:hypothetical protein